MPQKLLRVTSTDIYVRAVRQPHVCQVKEEGQSAISVDIVMKALTISHLLFVIGVAGKTPPHSRAHQHGFRTKILASNGAQLGIGGESLQDRRGRESVEKLAEFEGAPRLPLDDFLLTITKGKVRVSIGETGRHRRKRQQLFDDISAKMQAWEEPILKYHASRFIDIYILNKRLPGERQRLSV